MPRAAVRTPQAANRTPRAGLPPGRRPSRPEPFLPCSPAATACPPTIWPACTARWPGKAPAPRPPGSPKPWANPKPQARAAPLVSPGPASRKPWANPNPQANLYPRADPKLRANLNLGSLKPWANPKPLGSSKPRASSKPTVNPSPANPKPRASPKPWANPKPQASPKPQANPKPRVSPKPRLSPNPANARTRTNPKPRVSPKPWANPSPASPKPRLSPNPASRKPWANPKPRANPSPVSPKPAAPRPAAPAAAERLERARRAGRRCAQWLREAAQARQDYPGLDLKAELAAPTRGRFLALLRGGVDVKTAYEVLHKEELIGGAMHYAAQVTERQTLERLRERTSRPRENGGGTAPAAPAKKDPRAFTKKERDEIARRVMRGERIEF